MKGPPRRPYSQFPRGLEHCLNTARLFTRFRVPFPRARSWRTRCGTLLCLLWALTAALLLPCPSVLAAEAIKIPSPPPAPKNDDNDKARLFGTVEFRGPIKNLPQWTDMQARHAKNNIFVAGFKLNASVTWDKLKDMLKDKPPLEKLRGVNSFWNQWPYKLDRVVYGKEDYWAAPYEFRKNSGDCEDYAIAKFYTLKELGISADKMRIVVVKDSILNVAHAVLAVYLDEDIYILDNIAKNVLSHTRVRNYQPQYSVNEQFRWVHVRPK